jgi:hypothetical protein
MSYQHLPHRPTELEAEPGLLLGVQQRVALQVPELGVVPSVPGQECDGHLKGRHTHTILM